METSSLRDFEILKKLGEGAFGQVYQVRRKFDQEIYALKKVKMMGMKEKEKDNAINEIRILASVNNDFVVKFKDSFYDNDSGYLCIVMEYASGGDLLKLINSHIKRRCRVKEAEIWKAIHDIAKGLKSLHDKKILHRDLKSANIFIGEDGIYKLGDLNVSKVLKKGLAHTQTGTPYYASPEVWKDQPYDSKSDMWSFGCVMYEMAALSPPFKANDLQGLYKKIKAGSFSPIPSCYSSELSEIISSMIKHNPRDRPSAEQILKNANLRKQVGLGLEREEKEIPNNDPLLNTIKFNPYNLRSLRDNLPKPTYENEESKTSRNSSKSRLFVENVDRTRVLSACGNMRSYEHSPYAERKNYVKPSVPVNESNDRGSNYLPPIPGRRYEHRDTGNRLRRVGQQVLEPTRAYNARERVHSLHK